MPAFSEIFELGLPILFLGIMYVFGRYWARETKKTLKKYAINGETEKIRRLLQSHLNRAYMDSKDADGMTPLMYAAREGRLEIVEYLVQRGADTKAQNNAGWTALALAESNGHTDVIRFLRETESPVERQTPSGEILEPQQSLSMKIRPVFATALSVPIATTVSLILFAIGWRNILHSLFAAVITTLSVACFLEKDRWKEFRESERAYHPSKSALISNAMLYFEKTFVVYAFAGIIVWLAILAVALAISTIWPDALEAIAGL